MEWRAWRDVERENGVKGTLNMSHSLYPLSLKLLGI